MLLAVSIALAFFGRVVSVTDGDTIAVMNGGKAETVRLEGIDCPERKQPFTTQARQTTSALIFGKDVVVEVTGTDRYGRTLGRISVDGLDVNLELVKRGMAWHFKRYSNERTLADAEVVARSIRVGLWADPKPIPPWEWRHR